MPGELTYPEVGASRHIEQMPQDAHLVGYRRSLGGPEVFDAAVEFVFGFGLQRSAGFTVTATTERAEPGTEVTMRAWFGPFRVTAPTRVVYVIEEEHRRGFAYGTLPGHPESGEELFLVERVGEETWFEVRAFSRPARWYTRLAGPVARLLQVRATLTYLDAASRAVDAG